MCKSPGKSVIKWLSMQETVIYVHTRLAPDGFSMKYCHRGLLGLCCLMQNQRSHWNNHYNCCFVQLVTWGIYCTDFLSQMTSQVKSPMQFMAYDNTEWISSNSTFKGEMPPLNYNGRIWMTGINYSNLEMHWVRMTQVITSQQWKPMKLPI